MVNLNIGLFAVDSAKQTVIGKSEQILVAATFVPDPAQARTVKAITKLIVVWRWYLAEELGYESRLIDCAAVGIPWSPLRDSIGTVLRAGDVVRRQRTKHAGVMESTGEWRSVRIRDRT